MLLGFLKPKSGKILFNDKDIHEDLYNWRNIIGFVPQDIFLMDSTIKDNITLGLPIKEIKAKNLDKSITNSKLENFLNRLKNGVDTNVGEFGDKISGGQRQRIAIARALYNNPSVLIFDEFTSSLDIQTEMEILQEIKFLKEDKIIILVSHKRSTLEICDKYYDLKEGKINEKK